MQPSKKSPSKLAQQAYTGTGHEDIIQLGDYQILGKLGQGGMGVVYKARHIYLQRIVAIKMLLPQGKAIQEQSERLLREARLLEKLDHPHIVRVLDVSVLDGKLCLIMEFIEGVSLHDLIIQKKISLRKGIALLAQVASAIHYAHEQDIIHRDLKPGNIMVRPNGEPVVMDFGLAKICNDKERLTKSGALMGTPIYMSPEQVAGKPRDIDFRSDIYALGIMLYELATGRPPFTGNMFEIMGQITLAIPKPPSQLDPKVPKSLDRICFKAIAKDKSKRYATAQEFAQELIDPRRKGQNLYAPLRSLPVGIAIAAIAILGVFWYLAKIGNKAVKGPPTTLVSKTEKPVIKANATAVASTTEPVPRPIGQPETKPATESQSVRPLQRSRVSVIVPLVQFFTNDELQKLRQQLLKPPNNDAGHLDQYYRHNADIYNQTREPFCEINLLQLIGNKSPELLWRLAQRFLEGEVYPVALYYTDRLLAEFPENSQAEQARQLRPTIIAGLTIPTDMPTERQAYWKILHHLAAARTAHIEHDRSRQLDYWEQAQREAQLHMHEFVPWLAILRGAWYMEEAKWDEARGELNKARNEWQKRRWQSLRCPSWVVRQSSMGNVLWEQIWGEGVLAWWQGQETTARMLLTELSKVQIPENFHNILTQHYLQSTANDPQLMATHRQQFHEHIVYLFYQLSLRMMLYALQYRAHLPQSIETLEDGLQLTISFPYFHAYLGGYYYLDNQYARAAAHLVLAKKTGSQFGKSMYVLLGKIAMANGQRDTAIHYLQALEQEAPFDGQFMVGLDHNYVDRLYSELVIECMRK